MAIPAIMGLCSSNDHSCFVKVDLSAIAFSAVCSPGNIQAEALFLRLELAVSHLASLLYRSQSLIAAARSPCELRDLDPRLAGAAELSEGHCDIFAGDRALWRQSQRAPPGVIVGIVRFSSKSTFFGRKRTPATAVCWYLTRTNYALKLGHPLKPSTGLSAHRS
jgi:hypothetical protein